MISTPLAWKVPWWQVPSLYFHHDFSQHSAQHLALTRHSVTVCRGKLISPEGPG
jgi:hypothetical protein